jgi:glycolate oxidase iron-sulfur subunit
VSGSRVDDRPFRERFAEYARTLDCVHCGLCVPHCPTHRVTGREADSPRGRIHLMRGWAEGRFELGDVALGHLDSCLVCRACESVCPSGIRMGEMAESFRREMNAEGRPTPLVASRLGRALLGGLLPHRERIALLTDALALYQRSGLERLGGRVVERWAPDLAGAHAAMPRMPARRTRRLETDRARPQGWAARGERRGRVALFLGCVAAEWFAPVHRATIRVLVANGIDVVVPDAQTCCGALDRHAGRLDEARTLLARNRAVFAAADVDAVVVNAAGCGASLREPLDGEPVGPPALDVLVYLAELGLRDPGRPVARRVAYDAPCHLLHAQRVPNETIEGLLARVPELEVVPLRDSDRCCGAGGVYNLLHPEMAEPILEAKVRAIVESGADTVATGNPGCAMQIAKGLRGRDVEVVHPIELLDAGYGGEAD